jgi:hypothetical protein
MVGFGSSLRMARRVGWERAYFDYETLKMLLSQIEAVYEEEGNNNSNNSNNNSNNNDDNNDNNEPPKRRDYREELFRAHDETSYDNDEDNGNDETRYDTSSDEDGDEEVAEASCLGWKRNHHKHLPAATKSPGSAAAAHAKKKQNQLLLPRREEAADFFMGAQQHQTFLVDSQDDGDVDDFGNEQTTLLLGQTQQSSYYSGFTSPGTPPTQDQWYGRQAAASPYSTVQAPLSQHNHPPLIPITAVKPRSRQTRRRRRRRQRQRRKDPPPYLRVAHSKARAITERFLGLLRADIEKVTLFAQSRLGELADTAGSLRFPSHEDGEYDGGMHQSSSSSEDEQSSAESTVVSAARALSPTYNIRNATDLFASKETKPKQKRAFAAVQRQINNFAAMRKRKPIFQRMDHIVGEDLLLLSAVDEADGYTAVGVELMHVLRYISVNVIAVRKICLKHDRLLMNRMLGGYYHHKRNRKRGEKRTKTNLGGSLSLGDHREDDGVEKLVGVYDLKIQSLANSPTVQVISSCIALALSEYEVSHSRAGALAKLNSQTKTPIRASPEEEEEEEVKFSCTPGTSAFGLSPSRWRVHKSQFVDTDVVGEVDVNSYHSSDEDENGPPSSASTVSLTRLQFTVVSIFALREAARFKKDPYMNFLSRASLVFTGPSVVGEGLDGCSREVLDFFVSYSPDAALLLDSTALYKGLREGQWRERPIQSVMLATLAMGVSASDVDDTSHLIDAISIQRGRIEDTQQNGFHHDDDDDDAQAKSLDETMLIINRSSVFLYATNYYMAHSTANLFAMQTGAHPVHAATIIGASSVGALFAAFFHARGLLIQSESVALTSMSLDFFRKSFLFAAFSPIVGNIVHALAVSWQSIPLAVFGRMWIGFGSIELLNRQLLSCHLRPIQVVPESAKLVLTQIYGVIFGLLLGAFLALFDLHVSPFGQYVATISSLHTGSYFMASLWAVYWLFVYFQFHRTSVSVAVSDGFADLRQKDALSYLGLDSDSSSDGETGTPQSIVYSQSHTETNPTYAQNIQAIYNKKLEVALPVGSSSDLKNHREIKRVASRDVPSNRYPLRQWKSYLGRLRRVVVHNMAIPVTLAGVLFCRLSHELLFTSCATVTNRYFAWNGSHAGLLLGLMSGMCFPANYICGRIAATFDERTVMKNSLVIICLGLTIMINWASMANVVTHIRHLFDEDAHGTHHPYDWVFGIYQYLLGIVVSFVGIVSLEGSSIALMSKVSPARQRFASCGTLVTFVSLIARIWWDCPTD